MFFIAYQQTDVCTQETDFEKENPGCQFPHCEFPRSLLKVRIN
jgi:hypothetical protein